MRRILLGLFLLAMLGGCGTSMTPTVTLAPLPSATSAPAPEASPVPATQLPSGLTAAERQLIGRMRQPAQNCVEFIEDVTVPDGSLMKKGTAFDKIWRFKANESLSGMIAQLHAEMNVPASNAAWLPDPITFPAASAGELFTVSITVNIPVEAPEERVIGIYQLVRSDGSRCGQIFWLAVNLQP